MSWIGTFGPGRRVAKLAIEPAPALDLVEVQTVGEGSEVTNLFHLERDAAFTMYRELGAVLRALWPRHLAGELDDGPWEAGFAQTSRGRLWIPTSETSGRPLAGFTPTEDRGAVDALVAEMNARREAGEKPRP